MNIPIGLINASWNGTSAEVWMPAAIVNKNPVIKGDAATIEPTPDCPNTPGVVYNAMIFPVINFKARGVIWYQGEANVDHPDVYSKVLSTLINAWRNDRDEQLPFYYVQIAPYTYGNNLDAAVLREQQEQVMALPNTGIVVTTDLVDDTTNIHPRDKKDVGVRLANWALAKTYNESNIVYASPMYKSMEIKNGEAIVSFKFNSSGLMFTGSEITEIYIAGNDEIFYPANAKIAGKNLVVWNDNVKNPVAVRYEFGNAAIGNLFSNNGLPVAPFRTDSWAIDQQVSIAYDSH
jgi:sialate O-acetylesterase